MWSGEFSVQYVAASDLALVTEGFYIDNNLVMECGRCSERLQKGAGAM